MLGRYQILKPLAKGGMAEVFLARTVGLKGFERHVVIKRILMDSGSDKSSNMLLDEARLVASLHHRNIVQVHDVGEEDGKYFFAMEYVHGEDVRKLLRSVKEKKQQIPIDHVITIITAAAAGLHHAHEQRGPDRKPLGIVHRDISPGNILLGFDGGVKVVDFGIAKANAFSEETQAGEMKGKVGYMSPEQCRAQPIDRRTDVFLLGIVLYELVTVKRLFNKGESRYETMAAIVEGNIFPPSRYRKDIPPDLETIILKALAPDPGDRYQTADDLRLVLEAFANRAGLQVSPSRLSDYLKELFGERPEPWMVDAPPPDPHLTTADQVSSIVVSKEALRPDPTGPAQPPTKAELAEAHDNPPSEGSSTPMAWPMPDVPARRRKTWIIGSFAAAGIVTIIALSFAMTSSSSSSASSNEGDTEPTPTKQVVAPEDKPAATPDAAVEEPLAATPDAAIDEPIAATLDAGVNVAAKPIKPNKPDRPVRPRPIRPKPTKPDKPVNEDLDSPMP